MALYFINTACHNSFDVEYFICLFYLFVDNGLQSTFFGIRCLINRYEL